MRDQVVLQPRSDEDIVVPHEDLPAVLRNPRWRRTAMRGPVAIELDPDRFISRPLAKIAVPLSRQRQMAALDVTAATPFRPDEIHALLGSRGSSAPEPAQYHIIRKSVIDPVIAALDTSRLAVGDIFLCQPNGQRIALRAAELAIVTGKLKRRAFALRATAIAVSLTLVVAAGTCAHVWLRYQGAILEVRATIEPVRTQALALRKARSEREEQSASVNAVRREMIEKRSATEIWEELSRALPDTAWLTDLVIDARKVRLSGYSAEASRLIATLEASKFFHAVEFTAPVVRVPGQDGERFSIGMEVAAK